MSEAVAINPLAIQKNALALSDTLAKVDRLNAALRQIKILAESDAPSEELEQAQHDLRRIHEIATAALAE